MHLLSPSLPITGVSHERCWLRWLDLAPEEMSVCKRVLSDACPALSYGLFQMVCDRKGCLFLTESYAPFGCLFLFNNT